MNEPTAVALETADVESDAVDTLGILSKIERDESKIGVRLRLMLPFLLEELLGVDCALTGLGVFLRLVIAVGVFELAVLDAFKEAVRERDANDLDEDEVVEGGEDGGEEELKSRENIRTSRTPPTLFPGMPFVN